MDDFNNEEQKRIGHVNAKITASKTKALKLKIAMERALQDQEDQRKLLAIYQKELELKKAKKEIYKNKKLVRKQTMERYSLYYIYGLTL